MSEVLEAVKQARVWNDDAGVPDVRVTAVDVPTAPDEFDRIVHEVADSVEGKDLREAVRRLLAGVVTARNRPRLR